MGQKDTGDTEILEGTGPLGPAPTKLLPHGTPHWGPLQSAPAPHPYGTPHWGCNIRESFFLPQIPRAGICLPPPVPVPQPHSAAMVPCAGTVPRPPQSHGTPCWGWSSLELSSPSPPQLCWDLPAAVPPARAGASRSPLQYPLARICLSPCFCPPSSTAPPAGPLPSSSPPNHCPMGGEDQGPAGLGWGAAGLCVPLASPDPHFLLPTPQVGCAVVAGLLHYAFLAAFCWMCLEGAELYVLVVHIFKPSSFKRGYLLLAGYGPPALIVAISAAAFPQGYGTERQ